MVVDFEKTHVVIQSTYKEDSFASVEEVPTAEPVRRATFSGGEIPTANTPIPQPATTQLQQQPATVVVSPPSPQPQQPQPQLQQATTTTSTTTTAVVANKLPEPITVSNPAANHVIQTSHDVIKYNTLSHVPRTATEVLEQLPERNEDLRSALFQLKAVHPFKASNESQLTIEAGDVISVYDDVNQGGWIFGLNENTNRIGWFPFSYTQVAELESLKTLSERLANLEDVFVKRGSRSLQESPNFNDARYRKLMVGEKADEVPPPPDKFSDVSRSSQHGSEYEAQVNKSDEYVETDKDSQTMKLIRQQARHMVPDETRYDAYSSLRLKTLPPSLPQQISASPRRSASRTHNYSSHLSGTLGKTHRSLGALYSENLMRDLSHGPPPPPPPLPLDVQIK
ncbi:hypothetical protein HELRODRAFT_190109 [Helobdella robusta]|uniref:SH3 domain-containing protein n=1 Tax=Helobdella robusta TaxID=6412 RepID=T1FRP6_HELRO|nr:hypothetical protein HELRODRAFT_190109 [Helobdella robusta]ESO10619.1 hypothetical protein HELRODRAFT_190109 [Helobdella robusta]